MTAMTYLDAAYTVLQQARRPLHYKEIARRALKQGLIQPVGLTPDATMGSRLYTDTKQEGSRFVRSGRGLFGLTEWEPSGLEAAIAGRKKSVRRELRERLAKIPPERFEALVAELLLEMGFDENTIQVTRRSNDGGIDVVGIFRAAGITHLHTAVQVKRWKGSVGAKVVRELRGSLEAHQHGIIITTGRFTSAARQEAVAAGKKSITLIDGETLLDLLIKHRVGVVDRQMTILDLDEDWWGEWEGETPAEESKPMAETPPAPAQAPPVKPPTSSGKTRITGMRLFDREYPLNTWREALITTCQVLAEQHGADFASRAVTLKGSKRQYIAPAADRMTHPSPIPGTHLWVETNLSARDVRRIITRLLELFDHPMDAVQFRTESPIAAEQADTVSNTPTPP